MSWFFASFSEVGFTVCTASNMNIVQSIAWDPQNAAWSLANSRGHRMLAYCRPAAFINWVYE